MNIESLKKNLLDAYALRDKLQKENKILIEKWESLKKLVEECEGDMKVACREERRNVQVGTTEFIVVPAYRKWIDYDAAVVAVGEKNRKKLDDITVITKDVDMRRFTDYCREGIFPEDARVKSYREESMTPRILVKKMDLIV